MRISEIGLDQLSPYAAWAGSLPKPSPAMLDTVAKAGIEGLPLIQVRSIGSREYEILTGIRVWLAAGLCQIHQLPVVEMVVSDNEAVAMVEQDYVDQGVDDPIVLAKKLAAICKAGNVSIAEAGRRLGLGRENASNHIRLLRLPVGIQRLVARGQVSVGHAKAIVSLSPADQMEAVGLLVGRDGQTVSVRALESWVKDRHAGVTEKGRAGVAQNEWAMRYARRLSEIFAAKVDIHDEGAAGRIVMCYTSHDELDGILDRYKRLGFVAE